MGKAYIIGTGPGDEELLTIKAVKVLENVQQFFMTDLYLIIY